MRAIPSLPYLEVEIIHALKWTHSIPQSKCWQILLTKKFRLQRWSFFYNDGMVMFFSQGTIVTDGFSMVLPPLDHHHWMFIYRSTIEIDGFSMVFPKFRCDGQRWFWPWKRPKNAHNRDRSYFATTVRII